MRGMTLTRTCVINALPARLGTAASATPVFLSSTGATCGLLLLTCPFGLSLGGAGFIHNRSRRQLPENCFQKSN